MKNKYDENRLLSWKMKTNDGEIPIYCIKPLNQNIKHKKILLFIQGLNGNGSIINYWNFPAFDNVYLVSYDARAQADNTCKPSRFYKHYVQDIDLVINEIKNKLCVDDVYLLGESWGSSLAVLYMKYFPNKIKGEIVWNMPYNVKDISKGNEGNKFKRNCNMLVTFLFSINTYDTAPFQTALTNNKLLIRTVKLLRRNSLSNKVIISSWLAFKPAWRFLFKNANNFEKMNIHYIQSNEDVLQEKRIVDKLNRKAKNVHIFDKGFHILTFDENENDKLFNMISEIVERPVWRKNENV